MAVVAAVLTGVSAAAASIPGRSATASTPEPIAAPSIVDSPVMEIGVPTDEATATAVMALGDTATALTDMDTVVMAIAVTGIMGAAITATDIAATVTADGVIMAAAGVTHGTDSVSALVSAMALTCMGIRTILPIRITRRIHTARMDTRIRPIHRNITNIRTHRHPVRGTLSPRRRRIAI